jgi:hypothetical protein
MMARAMNCDWRTRDDDEVMMIMMMMMMMMMMMIIAQVFLLACLFRLL